MTKEQNPEVETLEEDAFTPPDIKLVSIKRGPGETFVVTLFVSGIDLPEVGPNS